jgi:hypothetical protein
MIANGLVKTDTQKAYIGDERELSKSYLKKSLDITS